MEDKEIVKKKRKASRLTAKKIEAIVQREFKKSYVKIKIMETKFDKMIRKHDAKMYHFDKLKDVVNKQMDVYLKKMESMEEAFFILYHNIRTNQFLYANTEVEWWNEFAEFKKKEAKKLKKKKAS